MALTTTINDDFANDKDIQRQRQERKAFEEMRAACIQTLVSNLNLVSTPHKNLTEFCLIKSLDNPVLKQGFASLNPFLPLTVFVLEYYSAVPTIRSRNSGEYAISGTDEYFFGLLALKEKYPLTLITPETISEKIADLFIHADVNFDNSKKFSQAYYTVTNEKVRLKQLFGNKNLDLLGTIKELEIELNGNECLFRIGRRNISSETVDIFCEGAKIISGVLYG